MGKKDKGKKTGKGAEKTAMKTDKKLMAKQKKLLEKIGEVRFFAERTHLNIYHSIGLLINLFVSFSG